MKYFEGKVAVITGATRGIGRSIAERCVAEGMKVVLVGRDKETLTAFQDEVNAHGGIALAVPTDVSQHDQVVSLARKTLDAFGGIHLLVNNAGLAGLEELINPVWEVPLSEWEQTLAVNLWGVIYGIRVFTPIMLEQGEECHIVNVASTAGLSSGSTFSAYCVSKHGVVVLSESLYKGLAERDANVKVTVICPGPVSTDIVGRTMDQWLESSGASLDHLDGEKRQWLLDFERLIKEDGMAPGELADQLFEAIKDNQFYVLTHPDIKESVKSRMEDIIAERNPTLQTQQDE